MITTYIDTSVYTPSFLNARNSFLIRGIKLLIQILPPVYIHLFIQSYFNKHRLWQSATRLDEQNCRM